MNWKSMKNWMIVDARVRCRRERWSDAEPWLWVVKAELDSRRRGSTTPCGREPRMLSCSSVVRSSGKARRRYARA